MSEKSACDQKQKLVKHNYHDHSSESDNPENCNLKHKNSHKGRVKGPFPFKLFDMLTHLELTGQKSDVVSWLPHGRSFVVHNTKEFESSVLPFFFQQKQYKSFQRQLNIYSFNRITVGCDKGSYYHELFLRGKRFLSMGIHRTKVKGIGARFATNPDAEPDFYAMQSLPLSSESSYLQRNIPSNTELILNSTSVDSVSSWKIQLDCDNLFGNDIDFDDIISRSLDEQTETDVNLCDINYPSGSSSEEEDDKAFLTDMEIISAIPGKSVTDVDFMYYLDYIMN